LLRGRGGAGGGIEDAVDLEEAVVHLERVWELSPGYPGGNNRREALGAER
jgi:hypothetical protein